MKVRYDQEEDILLIETAEDQIIDHAEQGGPLISHFSADGHMVLLEILDASEFLAQLLKATMRSRGSALPMAG
jgi:uncharacterized protein YuzE